MMNLLTLSEEMQKYHYSMTTYYRRRRACLLSDYSDAIIIDGGKTLIDDKRGLAFIKSQREKKKRHLAGLE